MVFWGTPYANRQSKGGTLVCRPISRKREIIACTLLFFVFFIPLAGETHPTDSACAPSLEHSCSGLRRRFKSSHDLLIDGIKRVYRLRNLLLAVLLVILACVISQFVAFASNLKPSRCLYVFCPTYNASINALARFLPSPHRAA